MSALCGGTDTYGCQDIGGVSVLKTEDVFCSTAPQDTLNALLDEYTSSAAGTAELDCLVGGFIAVPGCTFASAAPPASWPSTVPTARGARRRSTRQRGHRRRRQRQKTRRRRVQRRVSGSGAQARCARYVY